jgi:hypothetical protein
MAGEVGIQTLTSLVTDKINFRRPIKNASRDGLASLIGPGITGGEDSRDNGSYEPPL